MKKLIFLLLLIAVPSYAQYSGSGITHPSITEDATTVTIAKPTTFTTGPILFPDGTVGIPALGWINDPDTGWYRATDSWRLSVNGTLAVTLTGGGVYAQSDSGSFRLGASADVLLTRDAAAALQLGADAASATAQTFKACDISAGTSDVKGCNLTIAGGSGRGTGSTGDLYFQVGPQTTTGNTATTPVTKLAVIGKRYTAADAATLAILNVSVPADSSCVIRLDYMATSGNASTSQTEGGNVTFVCHEVIAASSYVCATPAEVSTQLLSAGTLTTTWTATAAATTALNFFADTSVSTPSAWILDYSVTYNSGCTLALP